MEMAVIRALRQLRMKNSTTSIILKNAMMSATTMFHAPSSYQSRSITLVPHDEQIVVDRDEQSLKIGHEPVGLERLALEPCLLLCAERQTSQRPTQHGRHRHRGDDGHGHDHREQVLTERTHRQTDGGDNHLRGAAGVHAAPERE